MSDVRHEYIDGQVYAMAVASVKHNRIAINISNFLYNESDPKNSRCEVFTSDIKVRVESRKSFY